MTLILSGIESLYQTRHETDCAYYQHKVLGAARARLSITARTNPQITKAISGIDPEAWTATNWPKPRPRPSADV